jgi:hypothetical protein
MLRRTAALATTILLALAPAALGADSSLNGYADVGGVALSGVANGNGNSYSERSAVAGASAASASSAASRGAQKADAQGSLGTLPFTGYDALAFAGVGLILVGLGAGLRSALRSRDPGGSELRGPELRVVDGGRGS